MSYDAWKSTDRTWAQEESDYEHLLAIWDDADTAWDDFDCADDDLRGDE